MIAGMIAALALSTEGQLNVGVYVPSLFFAGAAEKATFLSKIEEEVSKAAGATATASFISDPARLAREQVWIADATEIAARDNWLPVMQATRDGSPDTTVAVYARKDWSRPFDLLRKGSLLLPGGNPSERNELGSWLLMGEPHSAEIARRPKGVRDVRTALSAVAAGESDGTVALRAAYATLDPKLEGLKEVTVLGARTLPLMVINRATMTGADAERLRGQLAAARLPAVNGFVSEWRAVTSSAALERLGRILRGKEPAISRELVLAPLPPLRLDLAPLLPPPPVATPLSAAMFWPTSSEEPLPDPPTNRASTASLR